MANLFLKSYLFRQKHQKIQYKLQLQSPRFMQENKVEAPTLTIGYYPFRGKAQLLRLLCNYLGLPYEETFFNPHQWHIFHSRQTQPFGIKTLPFLKHEEFVISGHCAMLTYIIQLSGRRDLLGIIEEHKIKIDRIRINDYLGTILNFVCNAKIDIYRPTEENRNATNMAYKSKIAPLLEDLEQSCKPQCFYFGYLTLIDFIIYEIINIISEVLPLQLLNFENLVYIHDMVAQIPQIERFETSRKAIKGCCPIRYFRSWNKQKRQEKKKMKKVNETTDFSEKEERIEKLVGRVSINDV